MKIKDSYIPGKYAPISFEEREKFYNDCPPDMVVYEVRELNPETMTYDRTISMHYEYKDEDESDPYLDA